VEKALRSEWLGDSGMPASQWAEMIAVELLKQKPPHAVWVGESASLMRFGTLLPMEWFDGMLKRLTGLGKIQDILRRK
jgi:hypothetical protein